MDGTFATNAEARRLAQQRSLETRRAQAATRKLEAETKAKMKAPPARGTVPQPPHVREVEEAMVKAAAGLPSLDSMFEVPAARRADALDMKLAGLRANSGLKSLGKDAHVRRRSVGTDVTQDGRAYGSEVRPRQLQSLAVDAEEPGRIVVYSTARAKNGERWVARAIPEQNFKAVIATGELTFVCEGCGGEHLRETYLGSDEWVVDYGVDACPAKETAMKVRCPVCAQRGTSMVITDVPPMDGAAEFLDDDESFVKLDMGEVEDPKSRLMRKLHTHMAWVHPSEAAMYGVNVQAVQANANMRPVMA